MSTDDALACVRYCEWAAEAWAAGDLERADRFFSAAVTTVARYGEFLDVYDDREVGR